VVTVPSFTGQGPSLFMNKMKDYISAMNVKVCVFVARCRTFVRQLIKVVEDGKLLQELSKQDTNVSGYEPVTVKAFIQSHK
jgi:hypothetical protein